MLRYPSAFACDPAARAQLAELLSTVASDGEWTEPVAAVRVSLERRFPGSTATPALLLTPPALRFLFELYDTCAFQGLLSRVLPDGSPGSPRLRVSNRMTRAAGKTTRKLVRRSPSTSRRTASIEIALSAPLLLAPIDPAEGVLVTGVRCFDRVDALLRVFEHELVHVLMFCLDWDVRCSRPTFRRVARDLFGHRASNHQLQRTPPAAADAPANGSAALIRPGDRVRFDFHGVVHEGIVNRITKRATVLVPDERGARYTDGGAYRKYYVPLSLLERI